MKKIYLLYCVISFSAIGGMIHPSSVLASQGLQDVPNGYEAIDFGVPQYQDSIFSWCSWANNTCGDTTGATGNPGAGNPYVMASSSVSTILSITDLYCPSGNCDTHLTCNGQDLLFHAIGNPSVWSDFSPDVSGIMANNVFEFYRNDTPIHCTGPIISEDAEGNTYVAIQYVPYDTRFKDSPYSGAGVHYGDWMFVMGVIIMILTLIPATMIYSNFKRK